MNKNQSLDRAIEILECFSIENSKIGLSELARSSGLPKATVLRLAETFVERGYLVQNPRDRTYQLGYKILKLGNILLHNLDYRQIAFPYMQQICNETSESVTLYIAMNEKQRLCVERVQSTKGLSRIVQVGEIFSINIGASGKVLLAFRDNDADLTDCRLTSEEVAEIRRNGYAISHAEREVGVSGVAVPIFDRQRQLIAALSVSGPSFRFTAEHIANIIKTAKNAAEKISVELGYLRNKEF